MRIEACSAEGLARRYGTPLYVYSKASILARFRGLHRAVAGLDALICYAMKANSNGAVCRLLARAGAGADIVSGGELARALAAGFKPGSIVFSGVGKTSEEISAALRAGILTLNVESKEELLAIEGAARRLKRPAPVSVRLNPDVDAKTHAHITTGTAANKFGVEEGEAFSLYDYAARSPWLRPRGIQCHIGSQITSVTPYRRAAGAVARLVARLAARGIFLELIDLGGGMGVTYKDERRLDLRGLGAVLKKTMAGLPGARLLLEPGRFLVGESGTLLTRVLYRKKTKARRFVIVDAAMSDLARPVLYDAYHPIVPVRKRPGRARTVDIVGPVCESGDFLAKGRALGPVEPGDLLAVGVAGAYGFAMSSQYNSRPRAAEVLVDGAKAALIRRRETIKDIIRGEM